MRKEGIQVRLARVERGEHEVGGGRQEGAAIIGPLIHPRPGLGGVAAQQLQRALLPPGRHRLRPRVRVAPLVREMGGGIVREMPLVREMWERSGDSPGPSAGGGGAGVTGRGVPKRLRRRTQAGDESGRRAEATHAHAWRFDRVQRSYGCGSAELWLRQARCRRPVP